MDELVQWLGEQIDEDERIALKSVEQAIVNLAGADSASVANWHVVERPATGTFVATRDQWDRVTEIVPTYGGAHSDHIAAHDPARVLREIDAKRDLLVFAKGIHDHHETFTTGIAARLEKTLRLYALAYKDRPGYRDEWRP